MHRDRIFVRSAWRSVACGLFLWLLTAPASAQSGVRLAPDARMMRKALAAFGDPLRRPAAGTYDIVALRVEFAPDTTRFTTGDGTFGGELFGGLEPSVDPLPHDAAYFQAHLDFLRHYVERVSDEEVSLRTHLMPQVVRVPGSMGDYAPTGPEADSDEELRKLARLVADAWTTADAEISYDMTAFTPGRTAFALFHAGVGRDIELIGTTLDKTPQDLPSLYFDRRALDRLQVPTPSFNGFQIDHSMILPRTESRPGTDFIQDEPFLFDLSINGLLAASFFNFLGVPDLFDTESGQTAIGRFGLMDAQGIFAYRGLFPPEPMAWTRQYLGWTHPVKLDDAEPQTVQLTAASLPGHSGAARAEMSDSEYFLVENRHRDPEADGLTMQIWRSGTIVEQRVENGDPEFTNDVIDAFIGGVVVGVDNYDWALPGGVDEEGNELNGGILVWHVDERRLRAGLGDNTVNVGSRARAVDLEEADGAQDIGFPTGPFGPQTDLGSPFDFFYEGNPATVITAAGREIRLYENRFGPDTYPSSETNAGGPSFIVLDDFTEPGAQMTFEYRREAVSGIAPIELESPEALEDVIEAAGAHFGSRSAVSVVGDTPVFYSASSGLIVAGGASPFSRPSLSVPASNRGGGMAVLHRTESGDYVVSSTSLTPGIGPPEWAVTLPGELRGGTPQSPLVRGERNGEESFHLVVGGPHGAEVVTVTMEDAEIRSPGGIGEPLGIVAVSDDQGSRPLVVGRSGAGFFDESVAWSYTIGPDAHVGQPVFGRDVALVGAVPVISAGRIEVLTAGGQRRTIEVAARAEPFGVTDDDSLAGYPVLVDLDDDGRLDVLTAFGPLLLAFTQSGALVRDFPVRLPEAVASQPLVARFEGENEWTVVAASADGYLHAFDATGRGVAGFPLEVGDAVPATPALVGRRLYSVSQSGSVKAWELPAIAEVWWGELHGTSGNDSFVVLGPGDGPAPSAALIDPIETYNWPNPVQDGSTYFRIRTRRDAEVDVTIIDAGGGLVDEIDMGAVSGGVPEELMWQADVQSGLYFARFTATTTDGERETRVVKMAVIR